MELNDIFKKLEEKEGFRQGVGQDEESIKELERKLNVSFPEEYKVFLRRYGYICWKGGRIYGVSKKLEEDVIHKNRLIREDIQPEEYMKLPEDAFLIEDYGDAYFMLFDKNSVQKGAVMLYLSENPKWAEKSWESFKVFLEEYCL